MARRQRFPEYLEQAQCKSDRESLHVSFNDQKLYEVADNTFTEAGKVGLWTKADSIIHFDDFTLDSK